MSALVKIDGGMVKAAAKNHLEFSQDQIQLIKDTICKGADDNEFKLFLQTCQHRGLDPFARQVFSVKRWDGNLNRNVMSIQVSIDGFRLIAERSEKYEGQTPVLWCGKDGKWVDVWLSDSPPAAAKIGVYKRGCREAIYAVARTESYMARTKDGNPTSMWKKMTDVMIAKCAESLALRKAFPEDLSGLYTQEEMAQASLIEEEHIEVHQESLGLDALIGPVNAAGSEKELKDLFGHFKKLSQEEKDIARPLFEARRLSLQHASEPEFIDAEISE